MAGILEGLAGMGSGLWDTAKSVGSGIGDFIGLDGTFGLGGADKAFSLANMGGAMGFGTGNAGLSTPAINPASAVTDMAEDPYELWLKNNATPGAVAAGAGTVGRGTSPGLAGIGMKDLASIGIGGYTAMNNASLAKNQIANQNKWMNAQLAEQARQVAKEEGSTQATTNAYNSLANRNASLAGV